MNASSLLLAGVDALGVCLDSRQIKQLVSFVQLIQKWNKAYNLVGVSDTHTLVKKHLLDSLAIVSYIDQSSVLDVGSGAGLPGIPLAIARPDLSFTLLDSIGKKARFMRQVVIELKLSNVMVEQQRIEKYSSVPKPKIVLSRAFAPLEDALKLLSVHCASKGQVKIMLGTKPPQIPEVSDLTNIQSHEIVVPDLNSRRHLLVATKL
ncbi:MAG: 16S rRNA (guanine(527)-N(7))-methyltransferase RsmG [Pseudomonadota bacterium]